MRLLVKVISIVLVLAVSAFMYSRLRQQGHRKAEQGSRAASARRTPDPFEETCARQANARFVQLGYKDDALTFSFNHFNAKLGRCFLEVISHSQGVDASGHVQLIRSTILLDAYAERPWGESVEYKGSGQGPVPSCRFTQPGKPDITCYSSEEFDDLVQPFME